MIKVSRKVILVKNNIKVVQESLSGEVSATPMLTEALRLPPTFCKRAADLPLSLGLSLKPMSLLRKLLVSVTVRGPHAHCGWIDSRKPGGSHGRT